MTATQTGVGTVYDVKYHEPAGVATVTTMDPHGFEAGDQVTLAGLAFTCLGSTGITTTIFPDPQQSYTVDSIIENVGTSRTFTTFIGGSLGYVHVFNPAISPTLCVLRQSLSQIIMEQNIHQPQHHIVERLAI